MPDDRQDMNGPRPPSREPSDAHPPQPPIRGILAWTLILAMMVSTFLLFRSQRDRYEEIPYASPEGRSLQLLMTNGMIRTCQVVKEVSGITYVKGELRLEDDAPPGAKPFKFKAYVNPNEKELETKLSSHGAEVRVPPQHPYLWQIISSALPVLLILGVLYFLFMRQIRSAGHGALSFGKSRARLLSRDRNKVTFKNVAGIDEAKEEVQEIIEFLRDPKKFQRLGGRIPKGVLLMGPPGTGKTLLAKAIAGEADVPFFSISGSDFVEMFVGVGASRVRDMFEQGKKNAPCIIFIDEIDAVGRSRFTGIGGGHDEREQTLNALLVEMDGFETQEGVIILAATNRPDVLDPALLRPGRFDRQIVIDLPDIDGREAILKMHSQSVTLDQNADLRRLARGTPGFSGADLENLLNEAALLAARQDKSAVGIFDLEEARDKVRWGRERRSRVLDEHDKKITAYHEAGHVLVQASVEDSEPIHKVTIIPRGLYLGATMSLPEKDRYTQGKRKLEGDLAVLMGGRVAEEIVFEDVTSGAASDLRQATQIARHMVCDWGMSEALGPQTYGENQELMFLGREINRSQNYSEETAKRIDVEVSTMLRAGYERARGIIEARRDTLNKISELLIEQETLDGRDVMEIIEHGRILSGDERDAVDREKDAEGSEAPSLRQAAETGASPGADPAA